MKKTLAFTVGTLLVLTLSSCSSDPVIGKWIISPEQTIWSTPPEEIVIAGTFFGKPYYEYQGTKAKLSSKTEKSDHISYYFSYSKKLDSSLDPRYKGVSLNIEYYADTQKVILKSFSLSNWSGSVGSPSNITIWNESIVYEKA